MGTRSSWQTESGSSGQSWVVTLHHPSIGHPKPDAVRRRPTIPAARSALGTAAAFFVLVLAIVLSSPPPPDPWSAWLSDPAWIAYRAGERATQEFFRLRAASTFSEHETCVAWNDYRTGERCFVPGSARAPHAVRYAR